MWDLDKKLVREIKFTEPVGVVAFMNEKADLMAGHGGKLSKILAYDYLPVEYRDNLTRRTKSKPRLDSGEIDGDKLEDNE